MRKIVIAVLLILTACNEKAEILSKDSYLLLTNEALSNRAISARIIIDVENIYMYDYHTCPYVFFDGHLYTMQAFYSCIGEDFEVCLTQCSKLKIAFNEVRDCK